MKRNQAKEQIQQLKSQVKAANQATNYRLLKLAVIMLVLAAIAAVIYGRIQI